MNIKLTTFLQSLPFFNGSIVKRYGNWVVRRYKINDDFKVFSKAGYVFHGLKHVKDMTRYIMLKDGDAHESLGYRLSQRPDTAIAKVKIICDYEPYPVFDAEDAMYENRRFCNYFFVADNQPLSNEQAKWIRNLKVGVNFCKITEALVSEEHSHGYAILYYRGEGDTMYLAIHKDDIKKPFP